MGEPLRRTTRQHRSGNSFSVRLPRDLAYPNPDQELEVEAVGDERILRPKQHDRISVEELFARIVAAYAAGATGLSENALVRPEWPEHRSPK